jgi:hypothetical protein
LSKIQTTNFSFQEIWGEAINTNINTNINTMKHRITAPGRLGEVSADSADGLAGMTNQ